jgi:hypothetical protein
MMLDGKLQGGFYVTAGPCFRDEPIIDEQHQYAFFKVELIKIYNVNEVPSELQHIQKLVHDAGQVVYELYGSRANVVKTPEGYDLEVNGIEIGSYGFREYKEHRWVYGTGLALPRTSIAYNICN